MTVLMDQRLLAPVSDPLYRGLVAYWPLGEASGETRADAHINGHDLTDNNGVAAAVGVIGSCAHPANATEYLSAADHAALSPTTAFTLSAWLNFDVLSGNQYIAEKGSVNEHRCFIMHARNTGAIRCYISGDGEAIPQINTAAGALVISTWYHLCFVYDGGQAVNNDRYLIYKDTVQIANSWGTLPTSLNDSAHAFTLSSAGFAMKGKIDEAGFWNRALNTREITRLYNRGNGLPVRA